MKKYVTIIAALCATLMAFGQQQRQEELRLAVVCSVESVKEDVETIIENRFKESLYKEYKVRVYSPENDDVLARYLNNEIKLVRTSKDFDPEYTKSLRLIPADALCVVKVSSTSNGEYIFNADIVNTERGEIVKTASYPRVGDSPVKTLDRQSIQRACENMIIQLGLGEKTLPDIEKEEKAVKAKANGKALALSLIPGVGLMQKGHKAEGAIYLAADVALIGAGVGCTLYANSQKRIMNDPHYSQTQYKTAKNNYNAARTVSYCFYGAAGVVYLINLIRSYMAEPKPGAPIQWYVYSETPRGIPGAQNYLSLNVGISYSF